MKLNYHNGTKTQVGVATSRNYYVPYLDNTFNDQTSTEVLPLNDWKMATFDGYFENVEKESVTTSVKLPYLINTFNGVNDRYPFPYYPPKILAQNNCILFKNNFEIQDFTKKHYLVLEGVSGSAYVFLNDKLVGYTSGSEYFCEFDFTDVVKETNELAILVMRFNPSSYIESPVAVSRYGISGKTYLLKRPRNHITNYKITTDVRNKNGIINYEGDTEAKVELYYKEDLIKTFEGKKTKFVVENCKLWSDEVPELYTLIISRNGEFIKEQVGIRTVSCKSSVFKINDTRVRIKGVAVDGFWTENGIMTSEEIKAELVEMKKNNVNAINFSCYLPNPELPKLCDELGMYLMINSGINAVGGSCRFVTKDFRGLSNVTKVSEFKEAMTNRTQRMVDRDRNRASVIAWEVGKEAGWNENMEACAFLIKTLDSSRPIYYSGSFSEEKNKFLGENLLSFYGKNYPDFNKIDKYLSKYSSKPMLFGKLATTRGNSVGGIGNLPELFTKYPKLVGGFITQWRLGKFTNKESLVSENGNQPALSEIKEIYSSLSFSFENGALTVFSNYAFKNIEVQIFTVIKIDGVVFQKQTYKVPVRCGRSYANQIIKEDLPEGYATLDIRCECDGLEICKKQFIINDKTPFEFINRQKNSLIEWENNVFYIVAGDLVANFTQDGLPCDIKIGENVVIKNMEVILYREPVVNDEKLVAEWEKLGLNKVSFKAVKVIPEKNRLTARGFIVSSGLEPLYQTQMVFDLYDDGNINVTVQAKKSELFGGVPRFGLLLELNNEYPKVEYFGSGEKESYVDRKSSAYVGLYKQKIRDLAFNYQTPQENGSHSNTRVVTLKSKKSILNIASKEDFSFNVYSHNPTLPHEKADKNKIYLAVDYKMAGVGSNKYDVQALKERMINDKEINFSFRIKVSKI